MKYKGAIVEESLIVPIILSDFKIISSRTTNEVDLSDRWHIHTVEADVDQLFQLSKYLKPEKWYAHFWNEDKDIIVVFPNKLFHFSNAKKSSFEHAIEHGLSIGIPREQLNFLIE